MSQHATTQPIEQQKQNEPEQEQLTGISQPHPHDVLCGRGGSTNRHVGNANFRDLVNSNKALYVTLTKRQKMMVARSIVQAIRCQDPAGRFLQKDAVTGLWFDIGRPRALEKTSQALREKASSKEEKKKAPCSPARRVVSASISPSPPSKKESLGNISPPKVPKPVMVPHVRQAPPPYREYRYPSYGAPLPVISKRTPSPPGYHRIERPNYRYPHEHHYHEPPVWTDRHMHKNVVSPSNSYMHDPEFQEYRSPHYPIHPSSYPRHDIPPYPSPTMRYTGQKRPIEERPTEPKRQRLDEDRDVSQTKDPIESNRQVSSPKSPWKVLSEKKEASFGGLDALSQAASLLVDIA